jgi:diadenosine tetraphosphate (Ap4A) HIT family hydrolase
MNEQTKENCIFCKIVSGDMSSFTVWEDDNFKAFLSIFPNTEGVTVVIPKQHYGSYAFDLPDEVLTNLILATKKVAKLLDRGLDDVGRTAMVFEGYGVDHVHAKLYPMHGTKDMTEWKPIEANIDLYFEKYPGYISSNDYKKEEDAKLEATMNKIKNAL